MHVYGQLIRAQFENLASDHSTPPKGVTYLNTSSGLVKYYDGSAWRTFATLDNTQTLTNKTLTSAILNSPNVNDYMLFDEESAPSTPSSGKVAVYAKPDHKVYRKDSLGNEYEFGAGADSGINLISAPNDANTLWAASGAGITVATTNTDAELPLSGVVGTAIKLTGVSGSDYARARFTMPEGLKGYLLTLRWVQRAISGLATGDFKVDLYVNSASDYSGSYTRVSLDTDASGVTSLVNASGPVKAAFLANNSDSYYELRFVRVSGTSSVTICKVFAGLEAVVPVPAISGPTAWTPTFTGLGTVTNISVYWSRTGSRLRGRGTFKVGTATATPAKMTLPTGLSVNTTAVSVNQNRIGIANQNNSTAAAIFGSGLGIAVIHDTSDSNAVFFAYQTDTITNDKYISPQNGSSIFLTNARVVIDFEVEISEWATTMYSGANDVEYAFNTSTSGSSDDTTSFGYGAQGARIGTITATIARRVNFLTPITATDRVAIEITQDGGVTWFELDNQSHTQPFEYQTTTTYGVRGASVSSTTFDVVFGHYRNTSTGVFGAVGNSWSAASDTYKWRVKKTRAGTAAGFGLASSSTPGLVNPYTEGSGVVYSATYTPTLTAAANVGTLAVETVWYSRNGKMITVFGSITGTPASGSGTVTQIGITLPVATDLTLAHQLSGHCQYQSGNRDSGYVVGDATNNRAEINFKSNATANDRVNFSFSYMLQ